MTSTTAAAHKPKDLDIGLIIGAPFKDKQWFTKSLILGAMCLIPVVGMLNLMGWTRAVVEQRLAGNNEELPPADFSHLGAGWRIFVAWLPLMGLMILVVSVGIAAIGGLGFITMKDAAHSAEPPPLFFVLVLFFELGFLFLSLVINVITPAITFLNLVDNEPWASVAFRRMWETMKAGGVQYLLLWVAFLIASFIGSIGVFACYIGMLVTLPLGQAMMGAAVADYARFVKAPDPSFPVDGGVGGSSGSPFGVKS